MPNYLEDKDRVATYHKVRKVIESCKTVQQWHTAKNMALQFSNELWKHSDAINYVLIRKLCEITKQMSVDLKIAELNKLGFNLPFIEYYSHEQSDCFKILNPYTQYREEKFVLCRVDKGFTYALDEALKYAVKKRAAFYGK